MQNISEKLKFKVALSYDKPDQEEDFNQIRLLTLGELFHV